MREMEQKQKQKNIPVQFKQITITLKKKMHHSK